jgi:hypothetical protein
MSYLRPLPIFSFEVPLEGSPTAESVFSTFGADDSTKVEPVVLPFACGYWGNWKIIHDDVYL